MAKDLPDLLQNASEDRSNCDHGVLHFINK